MMKKIIIVNAFDPGSYFIEYISKSYDNAISEEGVETRLIFPATLNSSISETIGGGTIPSEWQKIVDAIKGATTIAIFTSWRPGLPANSPYKNFVRRLFPADTSLAKQIWENALPPETRVRIISVIDDEIESKKHKITRDASMLPIHKADFVGMGFQRVYTRTYGYLKHNNIQSDFGQKILEVFRKMGKADATND